MSGRRDPRSPAGGPPPRPPVLVRWALALLLGDEDRQVVASELAELYERRCARDGTRVATAWYRRQVLQYPARLLADRLRFGGHQPAPRRHGAVGRRPGEVLSRFLRDLAPSARSLAKAPVSSLTIVLTVGLGIGGTSALFSAVHAVLLQPLPYTEPERLVTMATDSGSNQWPLSVVDFRAIEEQQVSLERIAAFQSSIVTLDLGGEVERIRVRFVTPDYFAVLGITPQLGRTFLPDDAEPGSERTAVLAHGFWHGRLGADPAVLGRTIRLDGNDYRVVGVLPPDTGPLEERRSVFPILQLETPQRRGPFFLRALGRLRPGTTIATANAELRAISERLFPIWQSSYTDSTAVLAAQPLHEWVVGDSGGDLLILLGAVAFVLLVASMNATNLLLARTIRRERELAIRSALGASRGRLLQHLLGESLLLASAGAFLGLALTATSVRVMASAGTTLLPRAAEISLSGAVLWFLLVVSLGSGLLFGLVPALRASRVRFREALHASNRASSAGLHDQRVRRLIVALQLAVAVPLLIGAGLLLTSYLRLRNVDPGVDPDSLLTMRISLPRTAYPSPESVIAFWDEATARIEAMPGVVAVGQGSGRPPLQAGMLNNFNLADDRTPPGQSEPVVPWPIVSPGYFKTLGIPLVQGCLFGRGDRAGTEQVAVVDQAWVRRFSAARNPIGRRFHSGGCNRPDCPLTTVVGVVGDVSYLGLDAPRQGTVYRPLRQATWWSCHLFVRTEGDPLAVLPAVRALVRELDPGLPLSDVATMEELMAEALATPRGLAGLIAGFAVVALLLATIGVYGVMSFFVQQHTRDIGIRMALGGGAGVVLCLVIGRGMRMVLLGVSLGITAALVLARGIASLLFQVSPTDSVTYAAVTALLVTTAFTACLLPAWRAAKVDPAMTLRSE